MRPSVPPHPAAFTLIELLVVISIIGILVAILLPALSVARDSAKLTTCGARLHLMGVGVQSFATDHKNVIPYGPTTGTDPNVSTGAGAAPAPPAQDYSWCNIATSEFWIGTNASASLGSPVNSPGQTYDGWGVLLDSSNAYVNDPKAFFCPGDDNTDAVQELAHVGASSDAFGGYIYRQLDQTTKSTLDDLGDNNPAGLAATNSNFIGVSAHPKILALDRMSTLTVPNGYRVNHNNTYVNLLCVAGHVIRTPEVSNRLAITNAALPTHFTTRIDQILRNADAIEDNGISNVPFP